MTPAPGANEIGHDILHPNQREQKKCRFLSLRPQGQETTFFLFALIWMEDIMAYLVGTWCGRHPIAGSISPKKTWEGTLAGLVAALGVAWAFQATVLRQQLRLPEALVLGFITGVLAFASDLSESLLKRGAGL